MTLNEIKTPAFADIHDYFTIEQVQELNNITNDMDDFCEVTDEMEKELSKKYTVLAYVSGNVYHVEFYASEDDAIDWARDRKWDTKHGEWVLVYNSEETFYSKEGKWSDTDDNDFCLLFENGRGKSKREDILSKIKDKIGNWNPDYMVQDGDDSGRYEDEVHLNGEIYSFTAYYSGNVEPEDEDDDVEVEFNDPRILVERIR